VPPILRLTMKKVFLLLLIAFAFFFSGCAVVKRAGIGLFYQRANLPESQVVSNVTYSAAASKNPLKHTLNLFLPPTGTNWPVLIFVHGGGWDAGDKDLVYGGADVYENIGRFFASRGLATAVINYRLQPEVNWREQVSDVAAALTWVQRHISSYGGNPANMFLMGHSAGGQLISHVALNSSSKVCGVISVSGAGLDLMDRETYALGQNLAFYEQHFRPGSLTENWQREASPITYVHPGAPPFLILNAQGEEKSLQRQSHRLAEALSKERIENHLVQVPGQSHSRMVLTLSRPDKTSAPAILNFIRTNSCLTGRAAAPIH
jgi:arylformamidase